MDSLAIKIRLKSLGNQAADSFMKSASSLNESIVKIAKDNSLSAEEIARVCEMANTEVFSRKYASEDNKMFEFELADAAKIISGLNIIKTADLSSDELEPFITDIKIERKNVSGMKKVATDKGFVLYQEKKGDDAFLPSKSQFTWDLFEKLSACKEEIHQDVAEKIAAIEKTADEFVHLASQYVLNGDDINDLYSWVNEARPACQNTVCTLFNKVAETTHMQHRWKGCKIEKTASAVPCDLINQKMKIGDEPVQIINGENPIIQVLDTLVEQARNVDKNMIGYFGVTDRIRFLKGRVHDHLSQEYQTVGDEVE